MSRSLTRQAHETINREQSIALSLLSIAESLDSIADSLQKIANPIVIVPEQTEPIKLIPF